MLAALAATALFFASCGGQAEAEPAIGEAFVAPASLQLREQLVARAELVATLKHGDRVEILGRRRRFYRVRTSSGAVGWTDSRQLLSTAGMAALKDLAEQTAAAPSQGQATVFDPLNVHTAPFRQAPTIFQITPAMKVEVIAHELAPRISYDPPEPLLPSSTSEAKAAKKPKRQPSVPPPPRPQAPKPPQNWVDLSGGPPPMPEPVVVNIPMDLWSLVRARDGRSGWVLSRMLMMSIPDEVAQYAERARIAAFFNVPPTSSGAPSDSKPAWLWATSKQPDSDFDSLRLFTYNTRRNRYETSYIERNLHGRLPILVERGPTGAATGFSAVFLESDGSLKTRVYTITGVRVRLQIRRPATVPKRWYVPETQPGQAPTPTSAPAGSPGWRDRISGWISSLTDRLHR